MTFLSITVVKVILKLSKQFGLEAYDEFSILDTLEFALDNKFENIDKEENQNIDNMCIFMISVIRVTEKFNKAVVNIGKDEVMAFYNQLGINNRQCIKDEFEAYKLMKFEIKEPDTFNHIYNMIENHLNKSSEEKMIIFDIAIDILRLVYCWKSQIYDDMSRDNDDEMLRNHHLLAASIICVALKTLNLSDIANIFESLCERFSNELSSQKVNQLSSKIYSLIQKCKD